MNKNRTFEAWFARNHDVHEDKSQDKRGNEKCIN